MEQERMENAKMVPLGDIQPYKNNVKIHSNMQVRRIANSISEYGWDQPIVVDQNNVIVKGHGRYLAAVHLGLSEVPVIARHFTEDESRLARIIDNKSAESEWDKTNLWDELSFLKNNGIGYQAVGFDDRSFTILFPDIKADVGKDAKKDKITSNEGETLSEEDETIPSEDEIIVEPFTDELSFLNEMSIVDYFNWHDHIIVNLSSWKESIASLLWVLENCEKSKVIVIYSNPTWGVDWPHSLMCTKIIEKMTGIKVYMAGHHDPTIKGSFEDILIQRGFPGALEKCWIESKIRIPQFRAMIQQLQLGNKFKNKVVEIIDIREETTDNFNFDRGIFKEDRDHYANPIMNWTDADIAKYFDKHKSFLHTGYKVSGQGGCMLCPKLGFPESIAIRKLFPNHWKRVLEWYAMSMRGKSKISKSLYKWMASVDDLTNNDRFSPLFSDFALDSDELEDKIEVETGEKLPRRPYLTECYNPAIHFCKNDLQKSWWKILRGSK